MLHFDFKSTLKRIVSQLINIQQSSIILSKYRKIFITKNIQERIFRIKKELHSVQGKSIKKEGMLFFNPDNF